ncbi:protein-disulfide reductase DsbD [Sulfurimonas sp.]|uniref:protein-disulfide reductase DsbD n=1 Tax=Sulfurimonas sp. TaxID=2022749 RepID=UPI0025EB9757|nr:protein-disulfide reductase DsbD [Sulfurimonas sp.]
MKKILLLLIMSTLVLSAANKFLMPDVAFIPDVQVNSKMQIEAVVNIAEEIYLYDEQLKLEVKEGSGVSISNVARPKSVEHHGTMVFLDSPSFLVTLQKEPDITGTKKIEFSLSYQGCSEQGLCYEPFTKVYNFDIDTSKLSIASSSKPELKSLNLNKEEKSETDAIADTIKSGSVFVILLTFLGFGLLLALTPCVFPMIPIISGVIISQGDGITTKKAFMLSFIYVLAMAVAYTIAGVLAGLFGSNLQAALQTPWVIYSFSAVFVALALSMFGYYELKLPDAIVAKASASSHKSGYIGVAIMGFLSALIVGPCVAAPLAGALVYIGQTGDAVLGGMALFSMSIGMGVPLILVGVSAGKFMPKPGAWMTMVSAIFGVMMLGVAIWMLERVTDIYVTMALYSMLGISFSIYLGTFDKDSHIFKRSVAVIMFIYSVSLLIGVLGGSTSMSKPLSFLKPQAASSITQMKSKDTKFLRVTSVVELDELLNKHKGKKIMIDFYADWCSSCKELEEVTFADAKVANKMREFILIKADVTANKQEQKDLSKKYGVFGPPVLIFFDEKSNVLKSKSIVGFIEPEEFLTHLNKI